MAQEQSRRPHAVVTDWARKYPLAPRWRREERLSLRTLDGVRISEAATIAPGIHRIRVDATLTGDRWRFAPRWIV